jgi:hypothetical protein
MNKKLKIKYKSKTSLSDFLNNGTNVIFYQSFLKNSTLEPLYLFNLLYEVMYVIENNIGKSLGVFEYIKAIKLGDCELHNLLLDITTLLDEKISRTPRRRGCNDEYLDHWIALNLLIQGEVKLISAKIKKPQSELLNPDLTNKKDAESRGKDLVNFGLSELQLEALYEGLLKLDCLDSETNKEDFVSIHLGNPFKGKIKWIARSATRTEPSAALLLRMYSAMGVESLDSNGRIKKAFSSFIENSYDNSFTNLKSSHNQLYSTSGKHQEIINLLTDVVKLAKA